MNPVSNHSIILQMCGILFASLIGLIATIIRIRNPKINAEEKNLASSNNSIERIPKKKSFRSIISLSLFFAIFVMSLISLVYQVTVQTFATEQALSATSPTPMITPQIASSTPIIDTATQKFTRLDEIMPIVEQDGNFFFNGWRDGTAFKIDGRAYSHGIGILFSETANESFVAPENSPNGIARGDCKEVAIEFALREKYSQLDFSVGIDNGDVSSFGDENTNGIAQMIIMDEIRNAVLFDTGWQNYSYANYEKSIDVSKVDILKVIYRTCGVSNQNKLKNPLRFAIVDPILILKSDAE